MKKGLMALSPMAVFMLMYLVVSFVIGDFYKMPLSVAFIVAAVWAVATSREGRLHERIEVFSRGAADSGVICMIWIFILAGAFTSLAQGVGSIEASVNFALSVIPQSLLLPGLFLVACFISFSIGTSVGTIVALTPFACELAQLTGGDGAFVVSIVLGGSFFGDNLSFISDTTIAATRSQGCELRDKFRANIWLAAPAAVIALIIYIILGQTKCGEVAAQPVANPWLIMPYFVVVATALFGFNVLSVLVLGILSAIVLAFAHTSTSMMDMCTMLGDGISGMGDLIVITLLAAGLLELIKHNGGIDFIIKWLSRHINGTRGAHASIAGLVSMVNLCTANNTIAIITVGGIAKEISDRYNLCPRRVASILDTCSCIVQSLLPYGAQTLLAASLAHVSPVAFLPYAFYPLALAAMVAVGLFMAQGK